MVSLSGADDPRPVEWEARAIDIAASTGVGRMVKLSSIVAEPGAPVAFWDWHGRVERHLAESGLPAVVPDSAGRRDHGARGLRVTTPDTMIDSYSAAESVCA